MRSLNDARRLTGYKSSSNAAGKTSKMEWLTILKRFLCVKQVETKAVHYHFNPEFFEHRYTAKALP